MHRTTLSFSNEDWRMIRKLAMERRTTISRLVAQAVAHLSKMTSRRSKSWRFDWKPRDMGQPNGDFRTREGMYEFISR